VQVVVYDSAGGTIAARLWWMLRWLGHNNVAVLDGGWQAWLQQGYAGVTTPAKDKACTFTPRLQNEYQISVKELMEQRHHGEIILLDARAADRFRGENEIIDPVAGHIPGAISAPCMGNLASDGHFLEIPQLTQRYQQLLENHHPAQVVCYCGSGVTIAHNILAMHHAGLPGARLYAGSWSHWITDTTRPIAVG
jgi:thiosulfate/3-mercaptopyruvate sulfurtransferase